MKLALVTGASLGIGYDLAKELATRGYTVFAGARRVSQMESLKKYGVIPIELDVTSAGSIERAKVLIEKYGDKLDILFNNAGTSCLLPCIDVSDDNFRDCYEVNVFGPMRTVRILAPLVINAQGIIAFTSSVSGIVPFPFSSVYSSLKAAISQYSATLRIEMKPFNVKVMTVITGGVDTNIADTRPMPESSLYNIPELLPALEERKSLAKRNAPQTPQTFAKNVCDDLEHTTSPTSPLFRYRGTMGFFLGTLLQWCPRWLVERIFIFKFGLRKGFKKLYLDYVTNGKRVKLD